ncbi:type IX secretion system PorP/SprF family membrane protein [Lewinella aquimaris]|uniref:Type IX secretion system PorP/SprF family membrane protein n=1 Tax=Neolewinella aquimaris TaxID=1835722 RepID=A0A840DXY6_9BACT|nr:PorP/SprF family type IX secretion system membrane protein [Neolewinella aquimaris]MBB4078084.1 type IX secretion system PorP/SprF family membrane protein [Neolewinella aquimaris]
MKLRTPQHSGLWILLLAVLACSCVRAQDARFSQLWTTPMLNNPALTGVMNGRLRVTANYQALYTTLQHTEGYRSMAASAEFRERLRSGNYAGFGVQLQHDRAGESNFVRSSGVLSGSYQQQLYGGGSRGNIHHYLAGGVQLGVGQRGFDMNKLWFSEQYFVDPASRQSYLDRSAPSGELYSGLGGRLYPDINIGVAWFATFGDRSGAYLGGAAYHLTRPNVSPLPDYTDLLSRRYVIHGGGELPLGQGYLSFLPVVRAMVQGPSFSSTIGGSFRYTQRGWREVALRAGVWGQLTNAHNERTGLGAVIVAVSLEADNVQLGLSYDLAVGGLSRATSNRGGFELSITYTQLEAQGNRVRCPKF